MNSLDMICGIFRYEFKYQFKSIVFWIVSVLIIIFLYMEIIPYAIYYPLETENDLISIKNVSGASDFRLKSSDSDIKNEIRKYLETVIKQDILNQNEKDTINLIIKDIDKKSINEILTYFQKMPNYYESIQSTIRFYSYKGATLSEAKSKLSTKLGSESFSSFFARRFCDRVAVFSCFIILFLFAFTFDRDRRNNINQIIYSKPIKPTEYVVGKYFGVLCPFLIVISTISIILGCVMYFKFTNSDLEFSILELFKYFVFWVFVSVAFAGALITTISLLLRNGIAAITLYLIYFIFMVKPSTEDSVAYFKIDYFHFMIRWDDFFKNMSIDTNGLIIQNRIIYLLLTFLLLAISILLWKKNSDTNKGVMNNAYKRLFPSAKV